MNIGIVVPYFTPYVRGNEYGLAQSLSNLGHNATIITSTATAPREKMLPEASEHDEYDFDVKYIPALIDVGDNPVTTGIKNLIRDMDVTMLQEDYPFICHGAYGAAKNYNIPTILSSERTYYPENIAKRCVLKILDATLNRRLRDGVDVLTAHCTAAREFMTGELCVKQDIKVIHVGVDTRLFKPMPPAGRYLTKGDFKILTAARLHKYKGLRYLIEAMKIIRKEIPGIHLYIAGKGDEEQNLKTLAESLHLNDAVTFLSSTIPNHEMPALYAECEVYVQPSIIEPYGIAVVEAMACGKPVVGTRVGGMKDTIDKTTGFLAEPANPEEIGNYIKLLHNEDIRSKMGANARKRAVEKFDWSRIGTEYMECIRGLLK